MPVYNAGNFLYETIQNVLCQTFTDYRFLIINDGSTDNSEDIILSFSDPRIVYCKNDKNLGLVATLNKGIGMTETEFLARMDADDLWEPLKLEKQISLLEVRSDVGICGTSIRKFGVINGDFIFPVENDALKVGFLFYCMMSHPSVVFRMSFLIESGLLYNADFYPAEDYKMWVDALDRTHIYNIPEVLVYYRQHGTQITQDSNLIQREKSYTVREELVRRIYPSISGVELDFFQKVFANLDFCSVHDYRRSKNFANLLLTENRRTQYIQHKVLKKELNRYMQIGYKAYILKIFFPEKKMKYMFRYIFSLRWIYLTPRRNARLLFDSLLNRK